MSREAVEVVRNAFEGGSERGLQETAETYWHPEIEYEEDPRWPGASRYKGRDAVLRCFQAYMSRSAQPGRPTRGLRTSGSAGGSTPAGRAQSAAHPLVSVGRTSRLREGRGGVLRTVG